MDFHLLDDVKKLLTQPVSWNIDEQNKTIFLSGMKSDVDNFYEKLTNEVKVFTCCKHKFLFYWDLKNG